MTNKFVVCASICVCVWMIRWNAQLYIIALVSGFGTLSGQTYSQTQSHKHAHTKPYTPLHTNPLTLEIVILWRVFLRMYVLIRTHNYTKPAIIPSVCERWHFNYMKVSWGVLALRRCECVCMCSWAPLSASAHRQQPQRHENSYAPSCAAVCVCVSTHFVCVCASLTARSSWMLLSVKTASRFFYVNVLAAHSHPGTFFSVHQRQQLRSQRTVAKQQYSVAWTKKHKNTHIHERTWLIVDVHIRLPER